VYDVGPGLFEPIGIWSVKQEFAGGAAGRKPGGPGITANCCLLEQSRSHEIATLVEER
jgi:hypothetical protein